MAPAYREIRASYDDKYITVYQAYNAAIAEAAVKQQELSASPLYQPGRATWIKPSWSWMMYRSGYSYKDAKQERILALKMKHEDFAKLLRTAWVAGDERHDSRESTVVQWDPERDYKIRRLQHRSIQIGVRGNIRDQWIDEWIHSIEDVTDMARNLKTKLDEDAGANEDELVALGLMPSERLYPVDDDIQDRLRMHEIGH